MAVPENAYSLHITHHAAINALLSLLLPRWGVSAPIVRNPGCRIATLACPGLGARYPFRVPVERQACAVPFPRNAHETRASRAPFAYKII